MGRFQRMPRDDTCIGAGKYLLTTTMVAPTVFSEPNHGRTTTPTTATVSQTGRIDGQHIGGRQVFLCALHHHPLFSVFPWKPLGKNTTPNSLAL